MLVEKIDHELTAVSDGVTNCADLIGSNSHELIPQLAARVFHTINCAVRGMAVTERGSSLYAIGLLFPELYERNTFQVQEALLAIPWPSTMDFQVLRAQIKIEYSKARKQCVKGTVDSNPAKRKSVNARMLEIVQKNYEAQGWTSTKWAKELKCAKSSIVETKAWKTIKNFGDDLKVPRSNDRRQSRRASDQNRD